MKNRYEIQGSITRLYVNCEGEEIVALIDTEDLPLVSSIPGTWGGRKDKKTGHIYVKTSRHRVSTHLHRLIMDCPNDKVVDHKDRNTLDNRRHNLRVVSKGVNNGNKRTYKNSRSGIKYVQWKDNAWLVTIKKDGRPVHMKYYSDLMQAIYASIAGGNQVFPPPTVTRKPIKKS